MLIEKNNIEKIFKDFEAFKSTIAHQIKSLGELPFVLNVLESGIIRNLWNEEKYKECFYFLATVDYLSRKNNIPLVNDYDDIRQNKLSDPLYPRDVVMMSLLSPSCDIKREVENKSIPEYSRFNIFEVNIFDSY